MTDRLNDRRRGAFLGLAIGDALGAAVEFQSPGEFEPVTGYRDGGPHRLAPGEWTDASEIRGVRDWTPEFSEVRSDADLALRGWVKHDKECLYFAFEITDDVLHGIDTDRWLPKENPKAHELSRDGYPWFGDEMELLLNASNRWTGDEDVSGDGT